MSGDDQQFTQPSADLVDAADLISLQVEPFEHGGNGLAIRIRMLSNLEQLADAALCHYAGPLPSGADDYLTEPVDEVALIRSVVNVIESKT